jgi:N-acetylmuramoyl-L-alanine amidase
MSGPPPRRGTKPLESGFNFRAVLGVLRVSALTALFVLPGSRLTVPALDAPPGPRVSAEIGAAEAELVRHSGAATPPAAVTIPRVPAPRPPRALADGLTLSRGFFGRGLALSLALDGTAPFRVFTLDAPRRLVIDLEGVDLSALDLAAVAAPRGVDGIGRAEARPGWARLIVDLARPFALKTAVLGPGPEGATLRIDLGRVDAAEFASLSGAPPGVYLGGTAAETGAARPLVVIDPGHGGVDPGAGRDGVAEKDVTLAFARALRDALVATGKFEVALTRDEDVFLALGDRVAFAQALGAAAFISIHANAVEDPGARGGIVFTLSEAGSSGAARARAESENRADRVAGLSARSSADPIAGALGDMRAAEARGRSTELARALAEALRPVTDGGTQAPLQSANFQVLRVPDIPAALLEIGFLSNDADRARLSAPDWRVSAASAVAAGLADWIASGGPLTRN